MYATVQWHNEHKNELMPNVVFGVNLHPEMLDRKSDCEYPGLSLEQFSNSSVLQYKVSNVAMSYVGTEVKR